MVPRRVLVVAIVAAALGAGVAVAGVTQLGGDGSPSDASHESQADEHASEPDHTHGPDVSQADASDGNAGEVEAVQPRHDHELAPREGEVPARAEASEFDEQLENFVVESDQGLAQMAERGYIEGSGTAEDPYVLSRVRVTDDLKIKDTTKHLVVENSYVGGQLTLNFAGDNVYVHHNYVHDLRVNENVERDARATGGLIADNEIDFIGQIRHFSGEFARNDVGPRPDDVVTRYLSDTGPAQVPDGVVWNFDGYHGAHVHNNTVRGSTIVKLHGHFHGGCQACPHHNHEDRSGFPEEGEDREEGLPPASPHSYRFHTLDFENNAIRAPGTDVALRVYDENHAGDDQTAASEPNPYLEDEHEHHQYVRLASNTLEGGSLFLDIVNAENPRHSGHVQEARFDVVDNHVDRDRPRGSDELVRAYEIEQTRQLELVAQDNTYTFDVEDSNAPAGYKWATDGEPAPAAGFVLEKSDESDVVIEGTRGEKATYGVLERATSEQFLIDLVDNEFDAEEDHRED
jgi:hypothetical protein